MKAILLVLALSCAACGSSMTSGDASIPVDAPLPGVDASSMQDAGPMGTDAGPSDAGPSTCATLPTSNTCNGTTRTVMDRPYCVHVPPGYHDGTRIPIVLMLHGYSADGETQAAYLGLNDVSDQRTFLLVKPNGTTDSVGLHFWNASPACCGMFATPPLPDDVAYLMAVLDDVESAYSVDTTREYVMGHSNGAFMTHRLACEHGMRFAAGASLAGAADPDCTPHTPISILEMHGDTDLTISYTGGTNPGASTAYLSVEETMAYWATANGCGTDRREAETRELVCDTVDHETHVERYSGCESGTAVELWRMQGAGHIPIFHEPDWGQAVMDFLFAHTR